MCSKNAGHIHSSDTSTLSDPQVFPASMINIGSITRNSSLDLLNFKARSENKKIYDAMVVASILHNLAVNVAIKL